MDCRPVSRNEAIVRLLPVNVRGLRNDVLPHLVVLIRLVVVRVIDPLVGGGSRSGHAESAYTGHAAL